MADYFLAQDAAFFEGRTRPALSSAWRERSFEPCRALCAELLPAALDYARRYHIGPDEPLLAVVARDLAFDRTCWRALVGEVLLFGAVEIPEFPANSEALCCLLESPASLACASGLYGGGAAPIRQALHGSRDLTFGAAVYRPDAAGYNNADDVARLADYLAAIRPEEWSADALPGDEEERADELAFVREWFPELADLYRRCRELGRALVVERIY